MVKSVPEVDVVHDETPTVETESPTDDWFEIARGKGAIEGVVADATVIMWANSKNQVSFTFVEEFEASNKDREVSGETAMWDRNLETLMQFQRPTEGSDGPESETGCYIIANPQTELFHIPAGATQTGRLVMPWFTYIGEKTGSSSSSAAATATPATAGGSDEWFEITRVTMTLNMKGTPVSVGCVMWANSKKEVSWTFDDLPNATDSVGDWGVMASAGIEPICRNVEVPDEHEAQVSETGCYVFMKGETRYIHTPAAVSNFGRVVDAYFQYFGLLPDSGWYPIGIGLVLPLKFQFFAYTNALHQVGFVVAGQIGTEGTGGQPIGITLKWLTAEPKVTNTDVIKGGESVKGKETETGCYLIVSREKGLGVYVPAGTEEIGLLIHPSARYLGVKKEAGGDWSEGSLQRVVHETPAYLGRVNLSESDESIVGVVWSDEFGNLSLHYPKALPETEAELTETVEVPLNLLQDITVNEIFVSRPIFAPLEGPPNENGYYIRDDYDGEQGQYTSSTLVLPAGCSGKIGVVKFPTRKYLRYEAIV